MRLFGCLGGLAGNPWLLAADVCGGAIACIAPPRPGGYLPCQPYCLLDRRSSVMVTGGFKRAGDEAQARLFQLCAVGDVNLEEARGKLLD